MVCGMNTHREYVALNTVGVLPDAEVLATLPAGFELVTVNGMMGRVNELAGEGWVLATVRDNADGSHTAILERNNTAEKYLELGRRLLVAAITGAALVGAVLAEFTDD